jgi:hypothetical protein
MVTIDYGTAPGDTYEERQLLTRRYFDGDCNCSRCVDDRKIGLETLKSRGEAYKALSNSDKGTSINKKHISRQRSEREGMFDVLETLVKLEVTRKQDPTSLCPNIFSVLVKLSSRMSPIDDNVSVELTKQAIESLGIIIRGRENRSWGIPCLKNVGVDIPFLSLPSSYHLRWAVNPILLAGECMSRGDLDGMRYWLRGLVWGELMLTGSLESVLHYHKAVCEAMVMVIPIMHQGEQHPLLAHADH